MSEHSDRRPFLRAGVLLGVGIVALLASIQLIYLGKALPGVYIGNESVAGRSSSDIAQLVTEKADKLKTLTFTYQDQKFEIPAGEVGFEINAPATAAKAMAQGRQGGFESALTPSLLGFSKDEINPVYTLNDAQLKQKLTELTADIGNPAEDARLVRKGTEFQVQPERSGEAIDVNQAVRDALYQVEHLNGTVALTLQPDQPTIKADTLLPAKAFATAIASQPLSVKAGDRDFKIPPSRLASWVTFVPVTNNETPLVASGTLVPKITAALGTSADEIPSLGPNRPTLQAQMDREEIGKYVPELAAQVDQTPVNARLGFADGKVVISGEPQDGTVVDRPAAVEAIASAAVRPDHQAVVPIVAKLADIRQETLDSLGIKTRIGTATTTFAGSPVNRTYNIGVGARKFNGVIIKPGEDFSFNTVLGDVGPETGYLPELVIKENATVPEYGGGLCQVSTTMFRTAMDAGLPITARTNHAYAVHYYAPIGMDATIYPPYPDLRFKNNTPGNILVQTSQAGTSLTYEFYGTSDGRTSDTEILHIAATEEGGGTASFRYVVNGGPDPIDRVFYSNYKPRSQFPKPGEKSLN